MRDNKVYRYDSADGNDTNNVYRYHAYHGVNTSQASYETSHNQPAQGNYIQNDDLSESYVSGYNTTLSSSHPPTSFAHARHGSGDGSYNVEEIDLLDRVFILFYLFYYINVEN